MGAAQKPRLTARQPKRYKAKAAAKDSAGSAARRSKAVDFCVGSPYRRMRCTAALFALDFPLPSFQTVRTACRKGSLKTKTRFQAACVSNPAFPSAPAFSGNPHKKQRDEQRAENSGGNGAAEYRRADGDAPARTGTRAQR